MLNKEYFLDYFDKEKLKDKNCLRNYKNRRTIFVEKIDGEKYYIKKYVPHKQRKRAIAFGLRRDRAEHYKFISEKLDKLGIEHVKPEFVTVNRKSFFERESLLVTKDGGTPLGEFPDFDKIQNRKLMHKFFDYFIIMCKNGIFPTDYNFGGALVKDDKLYLIDFDPYRTKLVVTKKFKEYIIHKLERRMYLETKREKEFEDYLKSQVSRVRKELGW
ncbi:hypothetical protein [uncultured Ilyobacter sp.]|uniref:hypothetical protein n=1 Tax=uncultured Ilyobacter sp. TaxID=544433 RepID=UPI0029F4C5E3|nr:hypothetical protein [uncultured Ilyobacter sp.]